jgi:hypothetical protein
VKVGLLNKFKIGSCGLMNWNPTSNRNRTELYALQLTSMKLEFVVDLAASPTEDIARRICRNVSHRQLPKRNSKH